MRHVHGGVPDGRHQGDRGGLALRTDGRTNGRPSGRPLRSSAVLSVSSCRHTRRLRCLIGERGLETVDGENLRPSDAYRGRRIRGSRVSNACGEVRSRFGVEQRRRSAGRPLRSPGGACCARVGGIRSFPRACRSANRAEAQPSASSALPGVPVSARKRATRPRLGGPACPSRAHDRRADHLTASPGTRRARARRPVRARRAPSPERAQSMPGSSRRVCPRTRSSLGGRNHAAVRARPASAGSTRAASRRRAPPCRGERRSASTSPGRGRRAHLRRESASRTRSPSSEHVVPRWRCPWRCCTQGRSRPGSASAPCELGGEHARIHDVADEDEVARLRTRPVDRPESVSGHARGELAPRRRPRPRPAGAGRTRSRSEAPRSRRLQGAARRRALPRQRASMRPYGTPVGRRVLGERQLGGVAVDGCRGGEEHPSGAALQRRLPRRLRVPSTFTRWSNVGIVQRTWPRSPARRRWMTTSGRASCRPRRTQARR